MPRRLALIPPLVAAGLGAGCAAENGPPSPLVFERVVVHCYRTLADPECFTAPVPGEQHRLTGVGVTGVSAVPARAGGPGA